MFLRQLFQCRLQNMLNKTIIKDVNYLQGHRRTMLSDLQDKSWRCSAGMLGGKGRREAALTQPFLPEWVRQSYRTIREKKQIPFFLFRYWVVSMLFHSVLRLRLQKSIVHRKRSFTYASISCLSRCLYISHVPTNTNTGCRWNLVKQLFHHLFKPHFHSVFLVPFKPVSELHI